MVKHPASIIHYEGPALLRRKEGRRACLLRYVEIMHRRFPPPNVEAASRAVGWKASILEKERVRRIAIRTAERPE